jgi:nicotinate-nucleotide adenylyltransferase
MRPEPLLRAPAGRRDGGGGAVLSAGAAPTGAQVTAARRRVGIMGGTFDPIHHGHLVAADEARWQFELDRVVFVPTGQPWQKPVGVSDAEDRYRMTVLATASNPAFSVSRLEIDGARPTYTVDTLRRVAAELGPGVRLFFITGADAVLQILTWKDPQEVLALAELIAATRPGHDLSGLVEKVPAAAGRVHPMRIPALAISSTEIRRRVAAGAPIRYLVPEGVAGYIEQRGLYRSAPAGQGGEPAGERPGHHQEVRTPRSPATVEREPKPGSEA